MNILTLNQMAGKLFKGIYMKDEENLMLKIGDIFFMLYASGDCCSETYVSDIVKNISLEQYPDQETYLPVFLGVEELELQEGEYMPRASRQDEDRIYGIKILLQSTDEELDCITIIYRNSSNGYYGGSMEVSEVSKRLEDYRIIRYDFHNPF